MVALWMRHIAAILVAPRTLCYDIGAWPYERHSVCEARNYLVIARARCV